MNISVPHNKIVYICACRPPEAPVVGDEGGRRHNYKRLSALILDCLKFSQNLIFMSRIEQR